jgi:outer membrane protein TolC
LREKKNSKTQMFWTALFVTFCLENASFGEPIREPGGSGESPGISASVNVLPSTLDIETAVQIGVAGHPALKAQSSRTKAAWERPKQAAALPDPMIMVGVDKLPLDGVGADYMFQVIQSFPLSRIRKRRADVESARARAEEFGLGAMCLDRELSVRLSFLDLWEWDRVIDISEQSVALAGAAADLALARYSAGSGGQVDVLRSAAERCGLEASLKVGRENRTSAAAALLASMGIPPGAKDLGQLRLEFPPEPTETPDLDGLLKEAKAKRPELDRAQAAVDEAEAAGRVARAQYFPQAQVLSGYMLSTMETDSYQGMLGVSVPLWLGWRNKAVSEAEARAEASRFETANLLLEIEQEVVGLHSALRAALVSRDTLRDEVLPMSEAAANAAFAAYAAGTVGLVSLIDAQRALYETRLEEERMRADVCRRHARLMRAAPGGPVTGKRQQQEAGSSPARTDEPEKNGGDPTASR